MKKEPNTCSYCGVYGHYSTQCFKKRREMAKVAKPVVRKPIKVKVDEKWLVTKTEWYLLNPGVDGWWYCHYCGLPLRRRAVTIEHMHPKGNFIGRSRKYDLTNLVAACWPCNSRKGSRAYISYCREFAPHLLAKTPAS